jgi:hypothetical protein
MNRVVALVDGDILLWQRSEENMGYIDGPMHKKAG